MASATTGGGGGGGVHLFLGVICCFNLSVLVLLSELVNMDEMERSIVRLISPVCFSFRQKDLLGIDVPLL